MHPNAEQISALPLAAGLGIAALPDCGLQLWLLDVDPHQQLQGHQIEQLWASMPYWAFAWAGGRVMASYLAANPHWVKGKRVLDLGCGSGIAGLAAAHAGAASVHVLDLDPAAERAALVNADLNGLPLARHGARSFDQYDLLLGSDLLYDPSSHPLLRQLLQQIPMALLAEPQSVLGRWLAPGGLSPRVEHRQTCATLPEIGDFDDAVEVVIVSVEPQ